MAGSWKGKRKKNQRKSDANKSSPINKQHGTSSSGIDVCEKQSETFDKATESGNKTVPLIVLKDSDEKNDASKIDIQMMLEGGIASVQGKSFNSAASSLKANVTFVANPQVNASKSMRGESSSDFDEMGNLDLANCLNEMDLEDFPATPSEDSRNYLGLSLTAKVEYLIIQVKQRTDSSKRIIIQTAKRFNDNKIELRNLRLQSNERESLLKQMEELDSFNSMLTEEENNLRTGNRELDRVHQAIKTLEAHNPQIQATNAVQKLCTPECKKVLLQVQKISKDTEKQIVELKRQFAEERRKIVELEQKLKQFNEDPEHAKATPSYGY